MLGHAQILLESYVQKFEKYFKIKNMNYNIHLLRHLIRTVRDWRPFWAHSVFSFESWNRNIGNRVTSLHCPCKQIADRYLISKFIISIVNDETVSDSTKSNIIKLMKIQFDDNGPEKFTTKGKVKKVTLSIQEKTASNATGYFSDHIECCLRARIDGVHYESCRKTKKSFVIQSYIVKH